MSKRFLKSLRNWTVGLLLLPTLWAVGKQTVLMLPALGKEGWRAWGYYAVGVAVYVLVDALIHRPMWMYVFGHELTHAVSGLMTGAKVHSFKASSKGGEVRLSKSNVFVALSPYVIPIYACFVIIVYAVLKHWWGTPWLTPAFQFLLGFTIAFHVALTFHAVHWRQPDLKIMGHFLSIILIVLGNLLILGFLGVSLFKQTPTSTQYLSGIGRENVVAWRKSVIYMRDLWIH